MMHLLRMVSVRHLLGGPLRSFLTIGGVAVGVATLVGVMVINRTVMASFRSTVDTIAGKADLTVAATVSGFDEDLLEKVRAVPGVTHASGALTVVASVPGVRGENLFVMGVDLLDDGYFRTYHGVDRDIGDLANDLEFLNSTDRMLVSERFAAEKHLKVGDAFKLQTANGARDFFVHGLVKETGPVKAFGGSVGVMYVGSAQEAFDRSRLLDRIDVAVDPKVGADEVQRRLVASLGPRFAVESPNHRGRAVENMIRGFQVGLNLGSGVALLVGVFLVYNTVAIGVLQRRREIGTLRALGATRLRIRALFTLEATVMGALGTLLGFPLGLLVARTAIHAISDTVSTMYVPLNIRDLQVGTTELLLGLLLGTGGSAFAALRPAAAASQVQPVDALRRDVAAGALVMSVKSWPAAAGGLLLLLVWPATLLPAPAEGFPLGGYLALLFVLMGATLLSPFVLRLLHRVYGAPAEWLLGIAGRLAAENFARAPVRTSVPVSALAIGVAMTIGIGGFVGSFKQSSRAWISQTVPADLFISSSARLAGVQNTPMKDTLGPELEKLDGVEKVDRTRTYPYDFQGLHIYIISITPEIYFARGKPNFLAGHEPTPEERAMGFVTVSENLSRRRNLTVGRSFEMSTPTGVRTYRVGAVVVDYTSDQGCIFMSRAMFAEHFNDTLVDVYHVYLADPGRLEEVRRTVTERFGQARDLYVLSNAELRQEAYDMIDGAFAITYAMELVAVVLALLGVINTLLAAVISRTRELGLLRAVGAGRGHLLRLITCEAALIGISGGAIGLAAGSVMGAIVVKVVGIESAGWSFPFVFPWKIALQMVAAAAACAVAAGLYPARRAAHLDVVEALAYE